MAHCARLNLRMQKELKLLLTDPPPGAAFPTLSDESSAPSLTSIDALLRGPEGTVYADGVFKIKIHIPERYPFQPPIVTFATPIYHPNIDNGGRICLDILNLPPKNGVKLFLVDCYKECFSLDPLFNGMWQPSLNISTVLTSIGLLLSEPNPDDGLMHEASRDYKYNRQAFDQNARSMTEKYARGGETESTGCSHGTQAHVGRSTSQSKTEGSGASVSNTEHKMLSLESLGSSGNVSTHNYSQKHIESRPLKESTNDLSKYTGNLGKLQPTRSKLSLSLKGPVSSHSRNAENDKENLAAVVPQVTGQSAAPTVSETGPKMALKLANDVISDQKQQNNEAETESSDLAEAVIVLDSEEESEDEVVHVRSKLSLAKRCLPRKRKMGYYR